MNLRAPQCRTASSFLGAFALTLLAASTSVAVTYTFENLTVGNLVGQDNWALVGSGSSFQITGGVGTDSTLVFQNPGVSAANFDIRQNNGMFSFGSFTGSETSAVLQFDVRVNSTPGENQNFAYYVGDVNGAVSSSPQIQYGNTSSGTNPVFVIVGANSGTATTVSVPGTVNFGDWVSVRLTMDFTANGGDGLGSLSFADLTQATGFTPVSGLQNVALGMQNPPVGHGTVTPSAWDTLWLRSDTASSATGDNLTVIVPEPGSSWLALAGGLFLGRMRPRRRC